MERLGSSTFDLYRRTVHTPIFDIYRRRVIQVGWDQLGSIWIDSLQLVSTLTTGGVANNTMVCRLSGLRASVVLNRPSRRGTARNVSDMTRSETWAGRRTSAAYAAYQEEIVKCAGCTNIPFLACLLSEPVLTQLRSTPINS